MAQSNFLFFGQSSGHNSLFSDLKHVLYFLTATILLSLIAKCYNEFISDSIVVSVRSRSKIQLFTSSMNMIKKLNAMLWMYIQQRTPNMSKTQNMIYSKHYTLPILMRQLNKWLELKLVASHQDDDNI